MKCQNCGLENPERHIYCERCGAVIFRPFQLDATVIEGPRRSVVEAIDNRNQTDAIVPPTLVWFMVVLFAVTLVAYIAFSVLAASDYSRLPFGSYETYAPGLYVLSFGSVISEVVTLYAYYRLVKRENDHYARERSLRTAIISLVTVAATTSERRSLVDGDLMGMTLLNGATDRYHRPWFWVLAAALPMLTVPIVLFFSVTADYVGDLGIYAVAVLIGISAIMIASIILQLMMFRFLGNSMNDHAARWSRFSIASRNALTKLGFPPGRPFRTHSLPERSFALYAVLTLLTGVFVYYWIYTLVKDPNEHFKYQWEFEDNLLSAIGAFRLPQFKEGIWVP